VGPDEWIVLQCVFSAFDVGRCQRVGRVLKAKVDDVLRRNAEETRPRHAQEAVYVSRIA